jgi:hypothetical protein
MIQNLVCRHLYLRTYLDSGHFGVDFLVEDNIFRSSKLAILTTATRGEGAVASSLKRLLKTFLQMLAYHIEASSSGLLLKR